MNNYYVFDFDGVVCDSTNECLVCSSNAMQKFHGDSNYKHYLSEFPDELIQSFSSLRSFVKELMVILIKVFLDKFFLLEIELNKKLVVV